MSKTTQPETLTLAAWILSKVEADEAAARAAMADMPAWRGNPAQQDDGVWRTGDRDYDREVVRGVCFTIYDEGGHNADQAAHVARHDPARVLAQCAAIRAVVAQVEQERHVVSEDCWFTCGAATEERDGGESCNDADRGTGCDCGRDSRVRTILTALAGIWGHEGAEVGT